MLSLFSVDQQDHEEQRAEQHQPNRRPAALETERHVERQGAGDEVAEVLDQARDEHRVRVGVAGESEPEEAREADREQHDADDGRRDANHGMPERRPRDRLRLMLRRSV